MRKTQILIGGVVILVVLGAVVGYSFLKPTEEASEPIAAAPVDIAESESVDGGTADTAVADPGLKIFQISQDESQVRFTIGEILRGQETKAVGTTNQVAGEIAVNFDDLSTVQIGTVQVNARTLATDSSMRDRTIGNRILNTGLFEFITFTPTAISGIPDKVNFGEPVAVEITGDLTIQNITNEVVFEGTVTPVSDTRLIGSASVIILRSDFDLRIPSVPNVAAVDEEVLLEIELVASSE